MNILITGGASGLGASITNAFAQSSEHNVFITYAHSQKAAKDFEKQFSNVKSFRCDFTDRHSVKAFIIEMEALDLDVLVHNAVTGMVRKHFHKISSGDFERSFCHNVLPVVQITQAAIDIFRKKKRGMIITILTAILDNPSIGYAEYAANKAYLASLSRSWANENSKFNISAHVILPSLMNTNFNQDIDERMMELMAQRRPNGKLLDPEEVAWAIMGLVHCDTVPKNQVIRFE